MGSKTDWASSWRKDLLKVTKQTNCIRSQKIILTQKKQDVAGDLKREESYILILSLFTPNHPFMDISVGE